MCGISSCKWCDQKMLQDAYNDFCLWYHDIHPKPTKEVGVVCLAISHHINWCHFFDGRLLWFLMLRHFPTGQLDPKNCQRECFGMPEGSLNSGVKLFQQESTQPLKTLSTELISILEQIEGSFHSHLSEKRFIFLHYEDFCFGRGQVAIFGQNLNHGIFSADWQSSPGFFTVISSTTIWSECNAKGGIVKDRYEASSEGRPPTKIKARKSRIKVEKLLEIDILKTVATRIKTCHFKETTVTGSFWNFTPSTIGRIASIASGKKL